MNSFLIVESISKIIDFNSGLNRNYKWDTAGRQVQVRDPPLHSWESQMTDNTSYDGNGSRVKSEKIIGGQITSTDYKLKSTVLGSETIGKLTVNQNGTNIKEFSAPAADGKMSQPVNIAGTFESFEWTAPVRVDGTGRNQKRRDGIRPAWFGCRVGESV